MRVWTRHRGVGNPDRQFVPTVDGSHCSIDVSHGFANPTAQPSRNHDHVAAEEGSVRSGFGRVGGDGSVSRSSALVRGGVVASAEEGHVVEAGVASVGPVFDVVGVAPSGWGVSSVPGAAVVPEVESSADRRGDSAHGASNVEWLAGAVGDDADDVGVAQQAPHTGCADTRSAQVVALWTLEGCRSSGRDTEGHPCFDAMRTHIAALMGAAGANGWLGEGATSPHRHRACCQRQ